MNRSTAPRYLIAAPLALALSGCGLFSASPKPATPPYEIEIETVAEQAARAVSESALEFTVPLRESEEAWGRAKLFFSQYTSSEPKIVAETTRITTLVSGEGNTSPYRYTVRRTISPAGYRFLVECSPAGTPAEAGLAERNARNLARFIREGTLEVTLLAR